MSLKDLYQKLILDHSRNPRHRGVLQASTHEAEGKNPLCGDEVRVMMKLQNDEIKEITFEGSGCAICIASASIMCEHMQGRSVQEAHEHINCFQKMVVGEDGGESMLGKAQVFAGVRQYPTRIKCAMLPWHAAKNALGTSV